MSCEVTLNSMLNSRSKSFNFFQCSQRPWAQGLIAQRPIVFTSNNGCWCWNVILLAGSQSLWLQKYRHLAKVTAAFDRAERFVVANLLQNPLTFPLCSVYLPTLLLRNGKMWLISSSLRLVTSASPGTSDAGDVIRRCLQGMQDKQRTSTIFFQSRLMPKWFLGVEVYG